MNLGKDNTPWSAEEHTIHVLGRKFVLTAWVKHTTAYYCHILPWVPDLLNKILHSCGWIDGLP
jgi:hypothetical protein